MKAIECNGSPPCRVQMQEVQSKAIKCYGYRPEDQSLYVMYHSGGLYRYKGVTAAEVAELAAAPSKGNCMVAIRNKHAAEIIDSTRWRVVTEEKATAPLFPAIDWGSVRRRDCWI